MGREVRKVPPNWKHPQKEQYGELRDQPMHDEHIDDVFMGWLADFDRIRMGELTDFEKEFYPEGLRQWLVDDGRPPDPAYYRPWHDEEATWFQVWETVSEGCPVTPPFATEAELVDYLVANGDFWDQKRWQENRHGYQQEHLKPGWERKAAEQFVGRGFALSMTVVSTPTGNQIFEPRDGDPPPA